MDRSAQKHGVLNLVALLVMSLGTLAVALYTHSLGGQVAGVFLGIGVLVAAVSWFQMRLEERERLEKLEFDEIARGGSASATLFNTQDVEGFPARRAREQFERFFVPAFTFVLLAIEAGAGWWIWRWLGRIIAVPVLEQPLLGMAVFGLMALVLFILGQYVSGLARLDGRRLLKPGASALLLGAYTLALAGAAVAAVWFDFPKADLILARVLCALLLLLATENVLTLLLEGYRPRVKGRQARLLYESRLVALLGHPEGIFTTVAHTLDYQFGFKVSDTWFYQFLRRSIVWLGLCYVVILLAFTCLAYIQPGESALLERFGKPVAGRELLESGFHLKLPWPIDAVHRFRAREIQTFDIGFEHEEGGAGHEQEGQVVLWTVSHYKEEFHLLVASREPASATNSATNNVAGKKAPPVNLLSVGMPVHFQITNLSWWAYNYRDSAALIRQIASREVVRYLVSVDVNEIMSTARFTAGEELRRRIQARADELRMGVEILFVGLQDVHPPVTVGAAYERVVGTKQKREADILRARAYAISTNAMAQAEAVRRKLDAGAESARRVSSAMANESLFTNQAAAYRAAPEVYTQRTYLQTLARSGANARKFVLATTNSSEILLLNMEDRIRDDILNQLVPAARPR
ncbi:MAG: hypothetical protein QOF48_775 [Verrucomicrobiota bacterium]|jgi:regulator of protease activity HflC (stomatin/prohibitin superfamily)